MATAVDIANMALIECGAESIAALDTSTERSRACTTAWPIVRRTVLRLHSWNPPIKRALLTPNATAPLWDYAKRYALPADSLRILEVDTDQDWRIEDAWIITDSTSTSLGIRYVYDQTDPTLYDSTLTDTMVLFLAYRIMNRICADKGMRDRIERQFQTFMAEAKRIDGQEQTAAEYEDDTFITVRG